MSIKATIDNIDYSGISTILVGGKTINLTEQSSGGSSVYPRGIAEMTTGILTPITEWVTTKTFSHNCSQKPDAIIVDSNFRSHYTSEVHPAQTTVVGLTWFVRGMKTVQVVTTSFAGGNTSTTNTATTGGGNLDGSLTDINDTTFSIGFINTRRGGAGLIYRWYAIIFNSDEIFTEA